MVGNEGAEAQGTQAAGQPQDFMDRVLAFFDKFSDHGVPLPMVRKNGRGDFAATCAVFTMLAGLFLLMFAEVKFGGWWTVPKYDPLTLILFISPSQAMYVWKRGQDARTERDVKKAEMGFVTDMKAVDMKVPPPARG